MMLAAGRVSQDGVYAGETCSYAAFADTTASHAPCSFRVVLSPATKLDLALRVLVDSCPAASGAGAARPVLPFARVECEGAGCAHFLKPCADDDDCGPSNDVFPRTPRGVELAHY